MKSNNRKRKVAATLQRRFTRIVLSIATLVAIVYGVVCIAKPLGTIATTEFQLFNISDGISFYEREREIALDTHRGAYATECDQEVLRLYAERNALINSDNAIVAFTANHKWYGVGIIFAFVTFVIGAILFIVKSEKALIVFVKIIIAEEMAVRLVFAGTSFLIMVLCAVMAKVSNMIWNQTKPKKKKRNDNTNIIPFRSQKRA